jgi:hypothetical protein
MSKKPYDPRHGKGKIPGWSVNGPISRDLRSGARGSKKGWDTRPPKKDSCPLTLLLLPVYVPYALLRRWRSR